MVDWTDFTPSADECRAARERTGRGLLECKRSLRLDKMSTALAMLDERELDPPAQTMLAVLKAMLYAEADATS